MTTGAKFENQKLDISLICLILQSLELFRTTLKFNFLKMRWMLFAHFSNPLLIAQSARKHQVF